MFDKGFWSDSGPTEDLDLNPNLHFGLFLWKKSGVVVSMFTALGSKHHLGFHVDSKCSYFHSMERHKYTSQPVFPQPVIFFDIISLT